MRIGAFELQDQCPCRLSNPLHRDRSSAGTALADFTAGKSQQEERVVSELQASKSRDRAQRTADAAEISRENAPDSPVVQHLQRQLANAFILYSNYKRYHWQTFGPLFRDLHLLFDEFATAVLGTLDELAERIRMIGQDPVAGPRETLEAASVKPTALGQDMREMVEEANGHVATVIREMREAAAVATDQNDPGSADVFARFVQIHEKHEWWLRDILEKRDGLCS
jgi:starvation-inducible DNA-binding protein